MKRPTSASVSFATQVDIQEIPVMSQEEKRVIHYSREELSSFRADAQQQVRRYIRLLNRFYRAQRIAEQEQRTSVTIKAVSPKLVRGSMGRGSGCVTGFSSRCTVGPTSSQPRKRTLVASNCAPQLNPNDRNVRRRLVKEALLMS